MVTAVIVSILLTLIFECGKKFKVEMMEIVLLVFNVEL